MNFCRRCFQASATRFVLVGAISLSHRKERAKEALEENRKILVALRKKDAGLAEEAVRNHIQRAAEIVNMKRNELYDT